MSRSIFDDWTRKGVTNTQNLTRNTIDHDKWDKRTYASILTEMQDLAVSENRLSDKIETGTSLFADAYYSLIKANPTLNPTSTIRPSHLINRAVIGQATELTEYDELRGYSVGDEIGAALACISMEPELETLYDKLQTEQQLANELAKQEHAIDQTQKSIDDMMNELNNPDNELDPEEIRNYQENVAALNAQLEDMMQRLAEGASQLEQQLNKMAPNIRGMVQEALSAGLESASNLDMQCNAWGMQRGQAQRLPAAERIELAKRFNNPRLKKIAELIGPMQRLAFAEQRRKVKHANDELYDLSSGNDLSRVLPSELMTLMHPVLKLGFYQKFVEKDLLQYELRGTEKVARGGIICCEDGSGSMAGERELWAKAVSISLLHIAKTQNRPFYGIHFGSPNEYSCHDFRDPRNVDLNAVLAWAELFYGGGTDFMTPLSQAIKILREEHEQKGAISGDIVFITDGACGVPNKFLEDLKEEQERLGFTIHGIIIGGNPKDEPLNTICDGNVKTIKDLTTGNDIRDIFRNV